jgi:hypothetical protein
VRRTELAFSFGTHNLHDEAGVPTFFAEVLIFCEAIAPTIIAKAKQKLAHIEGRLGGYRIVVCAQQRDLVVAFRRRHWQITGRSYTRYVNGWAGVSPNRGTFLVFLRHRATGLLVVVVAEHRINAAFPPYVRSKGAPKETHFRVVSWRTHTTGTLETCARLEDSGFLVLAGGDENTPHGVSAYENQLREVGNHFDRLAISHAGQLDNVEVLSRERSDHNRLRAEARLPVPTKET